MALPSPIPDNPKRWDGWRNYNSEDLYARLCLSYESSPNTDQIEENCRQLLVWWQKKLPLKNQPSNPVSQMLRSGIDEAPQYLAEARSKLLDPEARRRTDEQLRVGVRQRAFEEFFKFLGFATSGGTLSEIDENNLYQVGATAGLTREEMKEALDLELEKRGLKRLKTPPEVAPAAPTSGTGGPQDPPSEFRRLLRLSSLTEDDMTDDQRDALCNMGENLGLTGGQAEDLIDEYLEEMSNMPLSVAKPISPMRSPSSMGKPGGTTPILSPKKDDGFVASPVVNTSALSRARERNENPNFKNAMALEMCLVTSGIFEMGSTAPGAAPNEAPVARVTLSAFYMSRFPVTNEQFEKFDPSHRGRRAPSADERHPVVSVSSEEALQFCKWLSSKERREYRLPTEAEWEFAARGMEGRVYPWGESLSRGDMANFADVNTSFAWADPYIDDGFAETAPVGSYPRGAGPFGIEDMAGNVWEWCLDFFDSYTGRERTNPRGPTAGSKRIYRGGSWKSRAINLRGSARGFNLSNFSANDVGFRVVCEVK